jgi:hypothetical protein
MSRVGYCRKISGFPGDPKLVPPRSPENIIFSGQSRRHEDARMTLLCGSVEAGRNHFPTEERDCYSPRGTLFYSTHTVTSRHTSLAMPDHSTEQPCGLINDSSPRPPGISSGENGPASVGHPIRLQPPMKKTKNASKV